jgi:hypothetical protein
MKWNLVVDTDYWDMDNLEYKINMKDITKLGKEKQKFFNQNEEILPLRNEIYQASQILE